jgi:hypothetical protein
MPELQNTQRKARPRMRTMARKKKPTGGEPQQPPGPASGGHKYRLVGLRLPEEVRQQVQDMADGERRSLSQMSAILIEEALQARKEKGKK